MHGRLTGYVCLVTGASRGLGKGFAVALGRAGAIVYITGRTFDSSNNADSLRETARIIEENGGKAIPVAVDHTDDNQVAGLFARIRREQSGRLDVLVNNAHSGTEYMLHELSAESVYWEPSTKFRNPGEEWDLLNRVGLRNSYTCCVLATRMMVECRSGNACSVEKQKTEKHPTGLIVNVSSDAGSWRVFNVAFCAGKSALDRMSMEMARDLSKRGVDISIISLLPGVVRTETVVSAIESGDVPSFLKKAIALNLDIPPELPGRVVATLAEQPSRLLRRYSGRTLFLADLASQFRITKPDGTYPRSIRSLKTIAQLAGWKRLAHLIPAFIQLPRWVLALLISKF